MWHLFENLRTVNCQTKFLCSRVAISESHGSCSASFYVSLCVTQWNQNAQWGPVEARKLSFRSYIVMYRLLTLAKIDAEICHTYLHHRD